MLKVKINSLLDYIQPTKYIVSSEEYSNEFNTPVLTAGDTFLLGYTNDKDGIYEASKSSPIILFDDFTTAIKWVDFPFKVKSSACKIIVSKEKTDLRYCYYAMKAINFDHSQHKRYWISEYSEQLINDYEDENSKIVAELDNITDAISKKEQVILNLGELVKSRFIEMLSNVQTKKTLEELTTKITDGSHLPPKGIEKSDYLMLSSQNIYDELNLSDVRYLTKEDFEKENKRTNIQKGDVLLTIVGTIGRTYVVKDSDKYVFQRSVGVIKPIEGVLNGTYLSEYLKTPEAINQLESGGHGSSQKGIYLKDLKQLLIPLADFSNQLEFESYVELINKLKFIVQKEIKDLQELLDKKMDEYFGQ